MAPLAALLLLASGAVRADPLSWDPVADTAITATAGLTWATMWFVVEPTLSPAGTSTQESETLAIDDVAVGRWNPGIAHASDFVLYGSMAGAVATASLTGVHHHAVGARAGLVLESMFLTGTITDVLKLSVNRPRPYTRMTEPPADVQAKMESADAWFSFPSGHTSMTAAAAFSTASILAVDGVSPVGVFTGAALLTTGVGTMRVLAGRHYPSDVLVGGAIGAATGLVVIALHRVDGPDLSLSSPPGGGSLVTVSQTW